MKKLTLFICCIAAITANAQHAPNNLEILMAKDATHKTTSIPQFKKWKLDPKVASAYIDDKIEELTDRFIRVAPDTVIVLEHNTLNEWFIKVQYIRSDADAEMFTLDATGKIINKIRPFTGVVKGSDDGSLKVFKVVDKIDPYVTIDHETQVLSASEEGKHLQGRVDELLSKF